MSLSTAGFVQASAQPRSVEEIQLQGKDLHQQHLHRQLPAIDASVGDQCGRVATRVGDECSHKEVALQSFHRRSAPLNIASSALSHGLDSARRLDAMEWLVEAFDSMSLPDGQLFATFSILDRYAAASTTPIQTGPGAFALVLAAMLVSLKVSGSQRDVERAKKLVVDVSGSSRPWAAVRKAELGILRRLGFRVCSPTSRDLLERLLNDCKPTAEQDADAWETCSREKCADLARFLLELGVVHEPEVVYGCAHPPMLAALSALLLSLLSSGAPLSCSEALQEPLRMLDVPEHAVVDVAEAMLQRWAREEQKVSSGNGGSPVLEKWTRRCDTLGARRPSADEFISMMQRASLLACQRKLFVPPAMVCQSRARSVGSAAAKVVASQLAAPSIGTLLHSASGVDGPHQRRRAPSPVLAASGSVANSQAQTSMCRNQPGKIVSQLSRAATENLAILPGCGSFAVAGEVSPLALKARASVANVNVGVVAVPTDRSPTPTCSNAEQLVELTHVLSLLAAKSGELSSHAASDASSKHRDGTVASELLLSSALRMQWPADRRKVATVDAAATCRDAAAVLQEAAAALLSTAASLETGTNPAIALKPASSLETKRRRTFGGPTPTRAPSPGAGIALTRCSPHVRTGLRV
eukprot:TRINITY_DN69621_c0_g1_i1.p1 TRINITY_DN69621_c0_g1~~TRINITY_DN69621_c0_g1_i1.p1  ORF type:complete len:640 (-),score=123.59 TRINITY_DN69621_c0_g1_i1:366-2285(-)